MTRAKLSVTIIAKNEQDSIGDAINSVKWADEIIVVDSGSTDKTIEIANSLGAKVVHHDWHGYGEQKNFAQSLATHEWVLNIDADEIVPPSLGQAIEKVLAQPIDAQPPAYAFPRKSLFLGQWIRHGGWYPNYLTRLAQKTHCRWSEPPVHEQLLVTTADLKSPQRLEYPIIHDSFKSIDEQILTNLRFSKLGSQELEKKGQKASLFLLVFKPMGKFIETYLLKGGCLDGLAGFIISINAAHSMFLKYAFLFTKRLKNSNSRLTLQTLDGQPNHWDNWNDKNREKISGKNQ